jgi:L-lactate dehydrogenase complex protein LldF
MQHRPDAFVANAREALADADLGLALSRLRGALGGMRGAAVARLPEFEALRDAGRDIRAHTLKHLDAYLELFEAKVVAQGGVVHWAQDAAAARAAVLDICARHGARVVTKGKSMVSEEIALNDALAAAGIEGVETDLGEYIIQLKGDRPSHIIAPAIHLLKEQVRELFDAKHAQENLPPVQADDEVTALVREARAVLRRRFLEADVGITGANFCVAETGSTVIVTNEGNGDLSQSLPRVHIVLVGIEKMVPTLEDLSTLVRLLARSATGQEISVYTTFSTGPKRPDDADGPDEFHVVLLDNGRSAMLGGEFEDMLRCIRCAACLNACPVYGAVGGHTYGSVYPGPMGSVLTPALPLDGRQGIAHSAHLPNASTFCGRCAEVCPVRIPLPSLLRRWRQREWQAGLGAPTVRAGLGLWRRVATRPVVYRLLARAGAFVLRRFARGRGRIDRLVLGGAWTAWHDLPAPEGETFTTRWRRERAARDARAG